VQRQLIIVLALVMCGQSILAALSGNLSIDALCLRLAIAVLVSFAGVRLITRLIIGYASTSSRWVAPAAEEKDDAGN
jgi:hypothetical protein